MKFRGSIRKASRHPAFTRIDLVVVLFIIFLVGCVLANPVIFPSPRNRQDSLVCVANLAQVGRAYQLWAADHGDRNPFLVSSNEGGLRAVYLANNSWYQFAWISNQLGSPKVLVCPADTNTTRVAKDFSGRPDGGFIHPGYRNNAVSYMIGMHAQFYIPRSILGGDRNITGAQPSGGCSYAMLGALHALGQPPYSNSWGSDIHGQKGQLLFNDGSVEETGARALHDALFERDDFFPLSTHVLFPK